MVQPKTPPMTWRGFCTTVEPRSIAIDGYVRTGPRFNPAGPYANLNHHEEVDRLATRATCAQALMVVRQGLFETFCDDKGNPSATIFANDCDEDVCLTSFILLNSHLAREVMNPALNRLVFMEDMLDSTAGAYPFPQDLPALQELMWVFEPYHRFRASGQLDRRDPESFRCVIADVGARIMAYIVGRAKMIELDTRYERIGGEATWAMVREIGTNARLGVYAKGKSAFLAVRERPDGKFVYTLGRTSQFVPFPIPKFLKALNAEEGNLTDPWGGSDIIAGSPRVSGSKLVPDVVERIIKDVLNGRA